MTTATVAPSLSAGDTLPEVDRMPAEEATGKRLFSGEGMRVRSLARQRAKDPKYQKAFLEALEIYEAALSGSRRGMLEFQEAMSTSDFPFLFGDIISRELLPNYQAARAQWRSIFRRGTTPDFRTVKRYYVDGGDSVLPEVPQGGPYPAAKLSDGRYEYAVTKRGRRIPFLWETMLHDDLDALKDSPQRLALASVRSEDRFATALYATSTGPNGSFFSAPNKNLLTGPGSFLSEASLEQAFTLFGQQVDAEGSPIVIEGAILVVPPSLWVQALKILNAHEIETQDGDGRTVRTSNWIKALIDEVVVNPWLPLISTNPTSGGDPWYLFARPTTRPAGEIGFLRGHEEPEIFMKMPNSVRVGGGTVDPMEGDFETDGIDTKVRHVFGGTLMDPKMAVASQGIQGS